MIKLTRYLKIIFLFFFYSCDQINQKDEKKIDVKIDYNLNEKNGTVQSINLTYKNLSDKPVFFFKKRFDFDIPQKNKFGFTDNLTPIIFLDTIIAKNDLFLINKNYRKWANQFISDTIDKKVNFYFGSLNDSLNIRSKIKESDFIFLEKGEHVKLVYGLKNMPNTKKENIFFMKIQSKLPLLDSTILYRKYKNFTFIHPNTM